MTEKTYKFGKSTLTLKFGDITQTNTEIIVSSDDYYLSMGGGVSASILKAGGNEIAVDAAKKVPAKLGDVVITTAGRLKAKFVFHAITIGKVVRRTGPKEIVKSTTLKCLELLNYLGLNSISFPALGAGAAGFSYDEVAIEMSSIISEYLSKVKIEKEVIIYLFDRYGRMQPTDYIVFFEAFAIRAPQIAKKEIEKPKKIVQPKQNMESKAKETEQEIKIKRIQALRNILATLEDQRSRLEEKLIDLLEKSDNKEIKKVKEKLKENEELRLSRLKELRVFSENTIENKTKSATPTVFVSSTYLDLVEHRKGIKEQISRRKMIFIGMEYFGPSPDNYAPPASIIIEEVKKADIYIGIFGVRYGSIDQATGLSMTELEYREAKSKNKPMLIYIIKQTANVKVSDIEQDYIGRERLRELKAEILSSKVVYMFDTVADLERQVYEDLGKIKLETA
jgi:O-acetyl-ADP-ribose deacetylase (regulator of RNase III)